MLATIQSLTIKPATKKSSGQSFKLVGGVSEPIIDKASAADKSLKGNVTLSIQGGNSWGVSCKMAARYKLTEGGGTEITWTVRPDDPMDADRVRQLYRDIVGEQLYTVSFKAAE